MKLNLSTTIRMSAAAFEISTTDLDRRETTTISLAGNIGPDGRWRHVGRDERSAVARVLCELHGIKARKKRKPKVSPKQAVGIIVDQYLTEWERPEIAAFHTAKHAAPMEAVV